jgi:hypothetical protein
MMKRLPKLPYLQNLVAAYRKEHGFDTARSVTDHYREWLRQYGFKVPIEGDYLEFPDDFSDEKLLLFKLKWS